ncbi:MAG: phenylacetate-CoA oxygenase/reductase subunit PaaK [Bacteroidetes bacterium]|nr:MAG: phenylacetate-CoA oxygenase/reductase subunit PaaK [Bacteroidota bacterium]
MATHFRNLKIKDIREETPDCLSISFEIPEECKEEFQYIQGQNITVRTRIDGEDVRRSYSICSSPLENELRIAVKKIKGGKFSNYAFRGLIKNHSLDVLPPTGQFFTRLDASNKKKYLAFAAGSGITPVISIIKTTLATEPNSEFTLVYGNRDRNSIIFKEEIEALKNYYMDRFNVHHTLTREKMDAPISQGRIDTDKCEVLFKHLISLEDINEFFICGPESMIFSIRDWLEAHGVERKKIHFELFTVPGQITYANLQTKKGNYSAVSTEKKSKVAIKIDGITFDFELSQQGDSILNAALREGADLPFSCKGGVCASCRAKLIEGKVKMDTNYALEPDELEAGFILTCQSHPESESVMIDFDMKN